MFVDDTSIEPHRRRLEPEVIALDHVPARPRVERTAYVQDHTRGIAKVVDQSGVVVEQYEYDPYGKMAVFTAASVPIGSVSTVAGQVWCPPDRS